MKKKKEYLVYVSLVLIIVLIVVSNMLIQGITCNDEVQLRLNLQHGLKYFFKEQVIREEIYQGRILNVIGNLKFISYISKNIYVFRTIEIAVILIAISFFGALICKIFGNKKMGFLGALLALIFLPITFEHAVPNAFVIVICQPLILLLLSLLLYLNFFETEKERYIFFSCLFFFLGCCLYEFVVTYVLVYFVIIVYKRDNNETYSATLKKCFPHLFTAFFYCICYILQRMVYPSNYAGTSIKLSNIKGILNVIKIEWLSSLPGYYLINTKYKYLHNIYSTKIDVFSAMIILIFILSLVTILVKIINKNKVQNLELKKTVLIITTAIAYTVIPVIPNSITELYQEGVSENNFTSIPVSFFVYLAVIFILTWVIWTFSSKFSKLSFIPICIICVLSTCIYITNKGIAERQFEDYKRFVSIEELLSLNFWEYYPQLQINAPSFFETKDNLAIESGHWTDYIGLFNDGEIQIDSDNDNANCFVRIQDDNSFYMLLNNVNYFITKDNVEERFLVKDLSGMCKIANKKNEVWQDKGYVFYEIEVE